MLVEGRTPALAPGASVETISSKKFLAFLQLVGLDCSPALRRTAFGASVRSSNGSLFKNTVR